MAKRGEATFFDRSLAEAKAAEVKRQRESSDRQSASRKKREETEAAIGAAPIAAPIAPTSEQIVREHLEAQVPGERIIVKVPPPDDGGLRSAAEESLRQREAAASAPSQQYGEDPQAYAVGTMNAANVDFQGAMEALGARNPTRQAPRPFYQPTREYTDRMVELIPESEQAFGGVQRAELGQAQESLAITEAMAGRQQEMLVEMRARDQAEAQRRTAAMERLNQAQAAATQAADDFAAHADVDPRRGWTSQSAGMKFLAIFSAGLMGAAGMADPLQHIRATITEDIAAQQANIAKRSQVAQARNADVQGERSVYADFVAQLGDERSAALSYENARLQQFMTQMSGRLQAAGIQTLTAEQQQLKNQFEQQIAANNLELGKRIEANTPTVTVGGGPALNADQRRLVTAAGKQALTDRSAARESIVDTAGRRESDAAKLQVDAAQQRRAEMRGPHGVYQEAGSFAGKIEKPWAVVRQIDRLLEKYPEGKDFPAAGFGGRKWLTWGEDADVDQALSLIQEDMSRMRSGGAITEDEEARFSEQLFDGLVTGGDTRLRQNLRSVRNSLASVIDIHERSLSPEAREYVLRNKLLPDIAATTGTSDLDRPDPAAAREDP